MTLEPGEPKLETSSKAKLPHWLAYPMGAETMSRDLAGIPQFSLIKLGFNVDLSVANQKLLRSHDPHIIAKVDHWHTKRMFNAFYNGGETETSGERWTVSVYPVLKELRSHAQRALLEMGMPKMREWLQMPRTPLETEAYASLSVYFDPVEKSVTFKEYGHT